MLVYVKLEDVKEVLAISGNALRLLLDCISVSGEMCQPNSCDIEAAQLALDLITGYCYPGNIKPNIKPSCDTCNNCGGDVVVVQYCPICL